MHRLYGRVDGRKHIRCRGIRCGGLSCFIFACDEKYIPRKPVPGYMYLWLMLVHHISTDSCRVSSRISAAVTCARGCLHAGAIGYPVEYQKK